MAGDPTSQDAARIPAVDDGPPAGDYAAVGERPSELTEVLSRGRLRGPVAILGPAFVASVAYVDPGNFASNFQAGAEHGYLLLWVIVMANLMAILVQYLTSKLGLHTASSLPEVCRERLPRAANAVLWSQAEVIAMSTDLAEFTGAAVGLNLVFGIPLFPAGLVTAVVAFIVLGLEQRGYRKFELVIIALLAFIALGFLFDFFDVGRESYSQLAEGLIPRLGPGDTINLAVAIVGATVMPHVVYLHSALQKGRIRPANPQEERLLLHYDRMDCGIGLGLAGLVNMSMLCIAAALFHRSGLAQISDLGPIHAHLATMVGGGAALSFGIALIASGLSSSSVGTYAGQIVMAGFMGWKIPLYIRRIFTMIPSLLVLGLAANPTTALVYSQVVLSFGIPFALVPLILFTSSPAVMGEAVNGRTTTALIGMVTAIIIALNVYLLYFVIAAVL